MMRSRIRWLGAVLFVCLFALGSYVCESPLAAQEVLGPSIAAEASEGSSEEAEAPAEEASAEEADLDDEQIASRLRERLSKSNGMRNVSVTVEAGVVTLEGEVEESSARARAAEIATAQEGVVKVENEIVLGGRVSERIVGAFERSELKLRMLLGYLPLVVVAIVLVFASIWLSRWIASPTLARRLVGRNRFLAEVARQGLRVVVVLAGLLIALDLLDATALVGAVFGAAGLAGLAVGFAFKDLIENYVSSILLSLRRPFQPNDHVVIDGHEGIVVSLNTRATTLVTLDGNHLRLPNALVFKSVMLNYTRNAERRFDFTIGVGVDEDLKLAQQVGVRTLQETKGVLASPPPIALLTELGDSDVKVLYLGWVNQTQADFGKVKSEAIRRVKLALEKEGMDLPEPRFRIALSAPSPSVVAESTRQETVGPRGRKEPATGESDQGDVSLDASLQRQIAEEKRRVGESNLLKDDAPEE